MLRRIVKFITDACLSKLNIVLMVAWSLSAFACAQDTPRYGAPHRLERAMMAATIRRYSINLMWINPTLKASQKFLSSAGSEADCMKQLLNPVIKWAEANPDGMVYLWYDSLFTPQEAMGATNRLLQDQLQKRTLRNVELRDIRGIKIVASNPDCFSDQLPIYYRVDLLKPIIVLNALENENFDSAIYADLEVGDLRSDGGRMKKNELFSENIIEDLFKQGLFLNYVERVENQFMQLAKNDRMMFAVKHALINANLVRAVTALNGKDRSFVLALGNAPFLSTCDHVFRFFCGTAPGLSIKVNPRIVNRGSSTDPWPDYDPKLHGYAPFGLYYLKRVRGSGQPDPDRPGNWLRMDEMLRFPAQSGFEALRKGRNVEVRYGNDHDADESDVVTRKAVSSDGKYRCVLWE